MHPNFIRDTPRAVCIAVLAITLTSYLDSPMLARWLLIGGAPALSAAFIWPMCERRGLDLMRVASEPAGLVPFVVSNLLALLTMETIGNIVFAGHTWPHLLPLLILPAMLSSMAHGAAANGWMPSAAR